MAKIHERSDHRYEVTLQFEDRQVTLVSGSLSKLQRHVRRMEARKPVNGVANGSNGNLEAAAKEIASWAAEFTKKNLNLPGKFLGPKILYPGDLSALEKTPGRTLPVAAIFGENTGLGLAVCYDGVSYFCSFVTAVPGTSRPTAGSPWKEVSKLGMSSPGVTPQGVALEISNMLADRMTKHRKAKAKADKDFRK